MREVSRVTADHMTRERDHVTRDGKMGRRAGVSQKHLILALEKCGECYECENCTDFG